MSPHLRRKPTHVQGTSISTGKTGFYPKCKVLVRWRNQQTLTQKKKSEYQHWGTQLAFPTWESSNNRGSSVLMVWGHCCWPGNETSPGDQGWLGLTCVWSLSLLACGIDVLCLSVHVCRLKCRLITVGFSMFPGEGVPLLLWFSSSSLHTVICIRSSTDLLSLFATLLKYSPMIIYFYFLFIFHSFSVQPLLRPPACFLRGGSILWVLGIQQLPFLDKHPVSRISPVVLTM